jgi:hypothetical protein
MPSSPISTICINNKTTYRTSKTIENALCNAVQVFGKIKLQIKKPQGGNTFHLIGSGDGNVPWWSPHFSDHDDWTMVKQYFHQIYTQTNLKNPPLTYQKTCSQCNTFAMHQTTQETVGTKGNMAG